MGLAEQMKAAAVAAIANAQLSNGILGLVTNKSPFTIETEQKLPLTEAFLFFVDGIVPDNLKVGTRVLMIKEQGGQRYFVIATAGKVGDE